jgi:prepilin-type processing-associated H-X9-DG protein
MYTSEYQGWLPGPYTSGKGWNSSPNIDNNSYGLDSVGLSESHSSTTALQNFDWMSPVLGKALRLPENDVQRLRQLYTVNLKCPTNYGTTFTTLALDNEGAGAALLASDLDSTSYSFVLEWMCKPDVEATGTPKPLTNTGTLAVIDIPMTYGPRINRIAPTAAKAALVEGGRYIEADFSNRNEPRVTAVSFNAARFQHQGGNFAVNGYYRASDNSPAQLLPTKGSGSSDWNGKMSKAAASFAWRHSGGRMNIAFFDGHVEALTTPETLKASLYLPRGSVIKLANKTLDPDDTNGQRVD